MVCSNFLLLGCSMVFHFEITLGRWPALLATSAFVYFSHRPLLMCIIDRVCPHLTGSVVRDVFFVFLFVTYTPICIGISMALEKCSPKVYSVLSGGR